MLTCPLSFAGGQQRCYNAHKTKDNASEAHQQEKNLNYLQVKLFFLNGLKLLLNIASLNLVVYFTSSVIVEHIFF